MNYYLLVFVENVLVELLQSKKKYNENFIQTAEALLHNVRTMKKFY